MTCSGSDDTTKHLRRTSAFLKPTSPQFRRGEHMGRVGGGGEREY